MLLNALLSIYCSSQLYSSFQRRLHVFTLQWHNWVSLAALKWPLVVFSHGPLFYEDVCQNLIFIDLGMNTQKDLGLYLVTTIWGILPYITSQKISCTTYDWTSMGLTDISTVWSLTNFSYKMRQSNFKWSLGNCWVVQLVLVGWHSTTSQNFQQWIMITQILTAQVSSKHYFFAEKDILHHNLKFI